MWVKALHSICNMGTCGLPDMHTLGPAALRSQGVHIRQTTHAYVTYTKYVTESYFTVAVVVLFICHIEEYDAQFIQWELIYFSVFIISFCIKDFMI